MPSSPKIYLNGRYFRQMTGWEGSGLWASSLPFGVTSLIYAISAL